MGTIPNFLSFNCLIQIYDQCYKSQEQSSTVDWGEGGGGGGEIPILDLTCLGEENGENGNF